MAGSGGSAGGGSVNGGSSNAGAGNGGMKSGSAGMPEAGQPGSAGAGASGPDAGGAGGAPDSVLGGSSAGGAGAGPEDPGSAGAGGVGEPAGPVSVMNAAPGDLVITEVMVNPDAVGDALGEWLEVYNRTTQAIDLLGLTLQDGTGSVLVQSSLVIEPGAYVVFARNGGNGNGGVNAQLVYGDEIQLANGDDVVKISAGGTPLDQVSYDDTFPSLPGASMSLALATPDATANDLAESWCAASRSFGAGDLGSPGAANNGCLKSAAMLEAGALVVTEIMANPTAADDTVGEWFELYNPGLDAIDLSGLELSDDGVDAVTVDTQLVLRPGARAVFGVSGSSATNGMLGVDFVYSRSDFALANGPDEIILTGKEVVDAVTYTVAPAGSSISLDPGATSATNNDVAANWCSSQTIYGAGDKGTPGLINDACP